MKFGHGSWPSLFHTHSACAARLFAQRLALAERVSNTNQSAFQQGWKGWLLQRVPHSSEARRVQGNILPHPRGLKPFKSFCSHLLHSCGPNREQHLAAGVLVSMFDSEKGNVLFLNAFEYHFFVKCFKYLILRRCRLCYLVLKHKRERLCVDCGSALLASCQSSILILWLVSDFERRGEDGPRVKPCRQRLHARPCQGVQSCPCCHSLALSWGCSWKAAVAVSCAD